MTETDVLFRAELNEFVIFDLKDNLICTRSIFQLKTLPSVLKLDFIEKEDFIDIGKKKTLLTLDIPVGIIER